MAETYRGLTIRIGGDTTKLQKALHAANQAISGTQSELRKLGTALRLDPNSLKASQLQMGAMAEQASNVATKMAFLNQALEEVGNKEIVDKGAPTTLRQMVEETKNIQMQAALMRDGFNKADAALHKSYMTLTEMSKEFGSGKTFNVVNDDTDMDSLNAEFKKLKENLASLKSEFGDEGLKELGVKETTESLDELLNRIVRLKGQSKEYGDALKNANEGAKFKDLSAEAARTEATIMSFVNKLAKANETAGMKEAMDGLKGSLDSVNSAMESAKNRVANIDKALKIDPKNPELIADRMKAVADGSAAATLKVEALKKAIESFKAKGITESATATGELVTRAQTARDAFIKAQTALAKWEGQLSSLQQGLIKTNNILAEDPEALNEQGVAYTKVKEEQQRAYDSMSQKVDEYRVKVRDAAKEQQEAWDQLSVRELTEEMHQAEVAADNFGKKDATPKIDSAAFMQATQMISQAARRMASEVVQSSNEIDAAYRDMRKTVQGSETDLENLKKSAIEYSQTHITSADTMLEMQALGGQLGILIEDLEEFGKITSNLDISTNMDAEDIALRLGQVANVLDLDIEGMQGFSDALVRLGNNMPTQESNIMNIAQRFAAVANTANFSGSEILAWSAAIASTGQRSEMAATAIGNTVSAIEQSLADGGEGFNAFATVAQMSAKDFEKAWKDDPTEALKAFIEGLRTLKDSQESAVATLENMGITGVRQQQTLLGLSNTVDKLGDALRMSEDAWNGVDDQWGKAGDAAIEAGKKSEGFSGALAILQNNAKDLAQVFGDSLVEPMKAVSAVLNVVTDAMNAMPGPVRSIIMLVGGASLAFSTVAPVVKVFTTGLDALLKSTAASNGNLGAFITNVLGIGKAAEGASVGVKALHASVNMLAGVAVVTGFLAVVAAISSFINEVNTLRDATDGLEDSLDSMNDKYDEYASGASSAAESTGEFHKRMRDVISDQAALSDRISEKWGELGTNAAVIDEIVQKIEDLTSKEKLNSDEQAELAEAVRRYNDATGASVSVIEAQTGKLSMNTAELEKNAEAVKKRAESEAAYEMYKDTYKQRIQDQKAAEEAAKRFNEALEKSNGISKLNVIGMQMASAELATIKRDYDDLTKSVESADDMLSMLSKSMNGTQEITKEMSEKLIEAGESTKDLDNLTKEELDYVVAHWEGTAESVLAAIKTIKDHAAEASAISEAMSEGSKEAAKERAAALKKELDAEYKEMKRQLDAEYKDQQREYDREYKARQKSLDAKYKQAQKGYDAEYKAQQKAFDKAYKQLQKALDAEYKAQQKAFSDEYNSVKKVLDNEYNAVKKELDREYSAKKSGYDDQLKALKKAQDAEVDAFNKATDAKLKAMEREYKEKLRLLELEYGQYDKGIDEQVKALKEETEAEKKAIEERNQNDKIAELQRDVEKANSRRKRAEAEKALNDYIQEVEQKRNEDARALEEERLKETQEALKDELQQRKDALKEQYDSEVAAYKEKRSVELEALKEANQAEYDARKEQYDLDLEQLKEAQSIRLEAIKEAQTAELEALKEYQSAQLEAIKEDQSAQLETVKENQTAQLEALKESQTAALENLKDSQQQELDALKQHQQDQLEAMKQNHQEQLDEQKAANDKRVEEVKSGNATEESEQKKSNQKKSDEQKRANREAEEEQERAKEKSLESHRKWAHEEAAEWRKRVGAAGEAGNETGKQYSEGINYWFPNLQRDVENAINNLSDNMEGPSLKSYNWGADMISNFASGVNFYWDHYGAPGIVSIAQFMADFLGFSVPKKGPLHHQDEWGGHFVENIIDGIKSKEGELARQVERMARTVEEGFDPTLTVDAAYEAIDAINKGRSASMAQLVAEGKSGDIKIEVNISDVSVRSDADIDRLASEVSRRMADQLRRQQAGRL